MKICLLLTKTNQVIIVNLSIYVDDVTSKNSFKHLNRLMLWMKSINLNKKLFLF